MAREKTRKSVGGALLPLGFFGSFCPKSFFLISCFFPARRLCLFRVVRCRSESLHVASKRNLGDQQFLRIEKSASNAEKQTAHLSF